MVINTISLALRVRLIPNLLLYISNFKFANTCSTYLITLFWLLKSMNFLNLEQWHNKKAAVLVKNKMNKTSLNWGLKAKRFLKLSVCTMTNDWWRFLCFCSCFFINQWETVCLQKELIYNIQEIFGISLIHVKTRQNVHKVPGYGDFRLWSSNVVLFPQVWRVINAQFSLEQYSDKQTVRIMTIMKIIHQ